MTKAGWTKRSDKVLMNCLRTPECPAQQSDDESNGLCLPSADGFRILTGID